MPLDRRAVLGGLAALAALPAVAEAPVSAATGAAARRARLRAVFDTVVAQIEERFYRVERLAAVNFRTKAEATWQQIADLPKLTDAVPHLDRMMSELKTSHMGVFGPDQAEFYILADFFQRPSLRPDAETWPTLTPLLPNLGFFSAILDGRHHVTSVLEGRQAALADVRIGDEIVALDDAPYEPVVSLRNRIGDTVTLTLKRLRGGATHRVMLKVAGSAPGSMFDEAMQDSARVVERGGKRIGYVHIWHMRTLAGLGRALTRIDGARPTWRDGTTIQRDIARPRPPVLDALVIDNRVKVGGHPATSQEYLSVLRGPLGGAVQLEGRNEPRALLTPSFTGRCAMLIDHGTRSAAELFAQGFKNENLGPVFGTRTAGAVSGSTIERLAGPMVLFLAISRVTINGVDLEGVGVEPTHRIERPIPYSAGADPVLEAALDHLAGV